MTTDWLDFNYSVALYSTEYSFLHKLYQFMFYIFVYETSLILPFVMIGTFAAVQTEMVDGARDKNVLHFFQNGGCMKAYRDWDEF